MTDSDFEPFFPLFHSGLGQIFQVAIDALRIFVFGWTPRGRRS